MISDVHVLVHVFVEMCISSLKKCLFRPSAHFRIGLFGFLIFSCMGCLHVLEINPLLASFTNIFSHSEGCLFVLFMLSLLHKCF